MAPELTPYLIPEPVGPEMQKLVASVSLEKVRTNDFLVDVNQQLQHLVGYVIRMEPGVQPPEQTLSLRTGSCRDSAWLLVQLFRNLGLAARFVSGYLIQLKPDVKAIDGPSGTEEDFTDLQVWTEVYLPGAGWIGLDPTSGLFAGEGHLPVVATPRPSAAAPISGGEDECQVEFFHEMTGTRVHEDPQVTLPYTDKQWAEIEGLGHAIDHDLDAGDVRLTMGASPRLCRLTTWTERSGIRQLSGRTSGGWRGICCCSCGMSSLRGLSCTMARGSGIRESLCPGGRLLVTGGWMACRCGGILT